MARAGGVGAAIEFLDDCEITSEGETDDDVPKSFPRSGGSAYDEVTLLLENAQVLLAALRRQATNSGGSLNLIDLLERELIAADRVLIANPSAVVSAPKPVENAPSRIDKPRGTPAQTFDERATRELEPLHKIIESLEHLSHAAANEDSTDSTITFEILEREANSALAIMSEIGDELRARLERES